MMIAWLPQAICHQIDKLTRDFIWKDTSKNGFHLVGWNSITKPKNQRGFSIRQAREANIRLLGKLVRDIQQKTNKFWVEVIKDKNKKDDKFLCSSKFIGSRIWNSISKAYIEQNSNSCFARFLYSPRKHSGFLKIRRMLFIPNSIVICKNKEMINGL